METIPTSPSQTEAQIMEGHRLTQRLSKSQFARALDVSRQRAWNWLAGTYIPPVDWLQVTAKQDSWPGEMAREILASRASELMPEGVTS